MRLFRTFPLLMIFGAGGLTGCPKTEAPVAALPTAEAPGDPKANFAEGVRILKTPDKSGDINYQSAYQWFEFAVKADPGYAKAHYNLGWTAERMGNMEDAVKHYRAAHEADPGFKDAFFNLGAALAATGRGDEAVDLYKGYVEQHPDDVAVRSNLIEALTAAQRYDEAVAQVREILLRDSKNVDAYRNLSRIYFAKGENAMSQLCAEKAKTLAEGDPGIYNNMGVTYLVMGNEPAAIKEFKTSVKLAPKGVEPNMNLGYVALNSGDYALALSSFEAALAGDPGNIDAMIGLAVATRGMGDKEPEKDAKQKKYAEAGEIYDRILKADPDNKIAYFNAATLHRTYTKDFKKAEKYLNEYIERNSGKLSPNDDVFKELEQIKVAQAKLEEEKRIQEQKEREKQERLEREKQRFEDLKTAVTKLEKTLKDYGECAAMMESGGTEQGMMILEQGQMVVAENEVDMAGDMLTFFQELQPQLDAIIPSCGAPSSGSAPAPAPAEGAPTEGAPAAPAEGAPAEGAPAPSGG